MISGRSGAWIGLLSLIAWGALGSSACSPATAETDDAAEAGVGNVTATTAPLPGSDAGANRTSEGGATVDPNATDGGEKKTASDASVDAAPETGALTPFGAKCTVSAQCASGLCLPFDKGLFCTKACTKDSECPSDDCGNGPRVCNID